MPRSARTRISPSLVIACVALLFALGGSGFAAVALTVPRNSVGTVQLKANAVVSAKVKNGSLLSADFKAGQLPKGPTGPAGPAGPAGPGATNWAVVKANGAVDKSTGVTTVAKTATGTYNVTFPSDVTACALLVSAGTDTAGSSVRGASANFNRTTTPTVIRVTTAQGTVAADRAFTIAVICPAATTSTTAATTTTG